VGDGQFEAEFRTCEFALMKLGEFIAGSDGFR
jgi:hypothetical protein